MAPGAAPIGDALKGYQVETWFGILAPAGTPQPIIDKLNAAIKATTASPELRKRFLGYGVEATSSTPAELTKIIADEVPAWRKLIEERHVKVE